VKFGIYVAPLEDSRAFGAMAAAVEELGFDSVFLPEHTHVPATSPADVPGGGALPHDTFRGGDPFIHLAAAALMTERVLLGTGATLLVERDPIIFAKQAATLDRLSGGRLVLGVGAGWNHVELRNHGIEPAERWDVFEEKLRAVVTIWTDEVAEFAGAHVHFTPLTQHPKPVQQPHPPLWISANGPRAVRVAAQIANGWQPILLPEAKPIPLAGRIRDLGEQARTAGRPKPEVTLFPFTGPPDAAAIADFERVGVDRVVYRFVAPYEQSRDALDAYAAIARAFG
jgi:probable F420-dependent oxidoreductase